MNSLYTLPPTLTLQLSRFVTGTYVPRKLLIDVTPPHTLDVSPFVAQTHVSQDIILSDASLSTGVCRITPDRDMLNTMKEFGKQNIHFLSCIDSISYCVHHLPMSVMYFVMVLSKDSQLINVREH